MFTLVTPLTYSKGVILSRSVNQGVNGVLWSKVRTIYGGDCYQYDRLNNSILFYEST